ncbi:MAG TPA: peptidoglycan-binding protein [Acidimicrobiales bacterium]
MRTPLAAIVASVVVCAMAGGAVPAGATPQPELPLLLRHDVGDSEQVVIVRSASWRSTTALLEGWERQDGAWVRALGPVRARIGRRGFDADRVENSGTSPAGVFTLTEAFGLRPDPGSGLPYRQAGPNSWWISDSASPLYNTWQEGPPDGRWNPAKGEHLATHAPTGYRYAAVVDFNRDPIVAGKGSAIFVHIDTGRATAGCTAISQTAMVALLRWLDPTKHPRIAQGPEAWLLKPGTISAPLRYGMRGEAVRSLQRALVQSGNTTVSVDGVFGPRTRVAVRAFQRSAGLPATGRVDAATATALGIWAS